MSEKYFCFNDIIIAVKTIRELSQIKSALGVGRWSEKRVVNDKKCKRNL